MREAEHPGTSDVDPKTRLEELIRSNRVVRFYEDIPDKEYPFVTCSIYGARKTNEIFVRLSNGQVSFVGAAPSRLQAPPMEDRIFGMDVLDQQDAFRLAEQLWKSHRAALLRTTTGEE